MSLTNFLELPASRRIGETAYFFLIRDGYPVAPGHTLVISKSLKADYFELDDAEKTDLHEAIALAKRLIEENHTPNGYNMGMNCGVAAGQTVFHFHCHVIPRYTGDMEDPRGGIRHCVAGKGSYG